VTESSDPNPDVPDQEQRVTFGGREEPATGDPTAGGKRGEIGTTDSIAEDEPDDGSSYDVGGGDIRPDTQTP
jgi:hypothetical protein